MSSENTEGRNEKTDEMLLDLRRLGTRMVLFHQHVGMKLGLQHNELKTTDILNELGPITAGELAHYTGLTTGTITALLDRMEKAGYVYRERDPRDRRRVIIAPHQGHSEIRPLYEPLSRKTRELLSRYDEHDTAVIGDFVHALIQIFQDEIHHLSQDRT